MIVPSLIHPYLHIKAKKEGVAPKVEILLWRNIPFFIMTGSFQTITEAVAYP